jgi:HEAT repeat protein
MMNRWLITVAIVCTSLGAAPSNGQDKDAVANRVRRLNSENGQVRAEARRELLQERNDTIAWLAAVIEERAQRTSQRRVVAEAMSALGDTRAPEAIDLLIRHIGYPRTAAIDDRAIMSPTVLYMGDSGLPAIDALVKIGEPCVDPLIAKIRATDKRIEIV